MQTLVTSCLQNGINPEQYIADVLIRVQTWPNLKIAELLPDRWRPPNGG